ncbi:MAG TPA: AMP-binding protein [Acidimicrobiales bacterium]|nr:AMP-binding protein [Acidimicrobiales bacterium]
MNLAALVQGHRGDSRALYEDGTWHTWGELRHRAATTAASLVAFGVEPGDRVAVAWPTSVDFVVAYLAVLATGGVAVPLNPNSPVAELVRELEVVTPAALLAGGAAARCATEVGDALTFSPLCVLPAAVPRPAPGAAAAGGGVVVPWEEFSGAVSGPSGPGADAVLPVIERDEDEVAALLFTSGTSGSPRAAMLTHGNLGANLRQMLALPGEIVRADDVSLAVVPLFHVFGLNVALGLALASGAALILEERFDPAECLRTVRELDVTTVLGVPTMFAAWVALAEGEPAAAGPGGLPGVRLAVSGAASLPAEVASRFESTFGVPVWQGYGLTEAAPAVSTSLGTGRNRPGSVGRPLPGVSVRLVDESGHDVLSGDPGEIWVRGPNVFPGYWRDPEASAEVLTADGWLRTGDVGVIGEEGDLFVVDRRKDVVIVSGFNVYPGEVETVVGSLPGVAEAVVVGRPDPVSGETVEVVVVVAPGAEVSEEQVREHCGTRLARYKCPTTVRFVPELPHGLAGKALRRALR